MVNGVVHRDWGTDSPTLVEHVGATLTVTSPGGFIGGVTPDNIITHPSEPRYKSLAEAAAALRLAERQGVGVDRMVGDMLALGHQPPVIYEVAGPYVGASLLGGEPDKAWTFFLAECGPEELRDDVDTLLLLDHLVRHGWVDAQAASPVLQRPVQDAGKALERLAEIRYEGFDAPRLPVGSGSSVEAVRAAEAVQTAEDVRALRSGVAPTGQPVVVEVAGVLKAHGPAWRLSDDAQVVLKNRLAKLSPGRGMIVDWAKARGRVSSTEAADLQGVSTNAAGAFLRQLVREGELEPGRANRTGRGFFYVPVE